MNWKKRAQFVLRQVLQEHLFPLVMSSTQLEVETGPCSDPLIKSSARLYDHLLPEATTSKRVLLQCIRFFCLFNSSFWSTKSVKAKSIVNDCAVKKSKKSVHPTVQCALHVTSGKSKLRDTFWSNNLLLIKCICEALTP